MTRIFDFRIGDIVSHCYRVGEEGTICGTDSHPNAWRVQWPGPIEQTNEARYMKLLRRPARVGDLVTWGTTALTYLVEALSDDGVFVTPDTTKRERIHVSWTGRGHGGSPLVHANGIPIEVPGKKGTGVVKLGSVPAPLGAPRMPEVDRLARALFETDPRVIVFVDRVSDWTAPGQRHCSLRTTDDPNWKRALQTAWDRNEKGLREEALERASEIHDLLGR